MVLPNEAIAALPKWEPDERAARNIGFVHGERFKNLYIVLKMNSRKRESSCLTSSSTFDAKIFCRSQRLPGRWANGSGPHLL